MVPFHANAKEAIMPVKKCSGGKYKIGSGKCKYDSKEKAQRAYKGYLAKKHSKGGNK